MAGPNSITQLPKVVDVPDQPCQQLYEANPVLLGYDVVHYHDIPSFYDGGVARQGSSEFAYNFNGYQFWFINQNNRNRFINDPWKYAPAWGGFCSWGIGLELKPKWPWQIDFLGPPASPWNGWKIVDGVLIFNIWASYTDRFMEDGETNMRLAAERWKGWFGELHAGPFNTHCIGHGPLQNWCLSQQPSPWLQSLPECEDTTVITIPDNGGNSSNVFGNHTGDGNGTVVGGGNGTIDIEVPSGGGIVSDKDSFEHFDNDTLSPYQRNWLLAAYIGIPLLLLAVASYCFVRRKRKQRGTQQKKGAAQRSSLDLEHSEDTDAFESHGE